MKIINLDPCVVKCGATKSSERMARVSFLCALFSLITIMQIGNAVDRVLHADTSLEGDPSPSETL